MVTDTPGDRFLVIKLSDVNKKLDKQIMKETSLENEKRII